MSFSLEKNPTKMDNSGNKIICLICQDYADHTTSKCPQNECKICGKLGHVNKDCPRVGNKSSPLKLENFGKLTTQCGNFMIFLSLRFYVKSSLKNVEGLKLPVLQI